MTNTPAYPRQVDKLNELFGATKQSSATKITQDNLLITRADSAQWFQHAALARYKEQPATNAQLFAILNRLAVPKNPQHAHNYTHYEAVVDYSRMGYRFYACHTKQVVVCQLSKQKRTVAKTVRV